MPAITVVLRMWFAVVLVFAQFTLLPLQPAGAELAHQLSPRAQPLAPTGEQALRISQVYGGGGSGKPCPWDFVELFNASGTAVDLSGWSVQVATASGAWLASLSLGTGSIAPYSYFLLASGSASTPVAPDLSKVFTALFSIGGKVRLIGPDPSGTGTVIVDTVGYGNANESEEAPAPALTDATAAFRLGGGCIDDDNNAMDFEARSVAPRNHASPSRICDARPAIAATTPGNQETGVELTANLAVSFSEPVTLTGKWFEVRCDLSGTRDVESVTVTGDGTSYALDPHIDFLADDNCTLTVFASAVHDEDTDDPPDTLKADYIAAFSTAPGQCGELAYGIGSIQGAGDSSPAVGHERTVEGIVTGDFQDAGGLSGYFLQEDSADIDEDTQTSEALFVDEHETTLGDVLAGARVRVTGSVEEVDGLTSLTNVTRLLDCGQTGLPDPLEIELPFASPGSWEQYEGMRVRLMQQLTVTDSAELGSRGRLKLVAGSLPQFYTQGHDPDAAGFQVWENDLATRTVVLEDGSETLYPDPIRYPSPGLSADNAVRTGDAVEAGLTAIVDERDGATVLQPLDEPIFVEKNPRTTAPSRNAGNVRVAFMSLGDYFKVTDSPAGARGASSAEEFARQRDKVIDALVDLNADIAGVSRVANDGYGAESTLADLVNALNEATAEGAYAFIDPGSTTWGSDVIAVGMIYRVSSVVPIGAAAILDTGAFDQSASPPVHRAPMAQTFEEKIWGERFTVVVDEWHDRAACPETGDDADAGDGQGCWNTARTAAADDLLAWLALNPTGSSDPDVLVLGELNAFPHEGPIQAFLGSQYVDLIDRYVGDDALTTLLSGRAGTGDPALASESLAPQAVGTGVWNVNAEEPPGLDYQLENKSASQQSSLYAPDPYRSADRNPIVVDLDLVADQSKLGGAYGTAWHTGQGVWRLGNAWGGASDGVVAGATDWNDGQGKINVSVGAPAGEYGCLYAWLDFSDGQIQAGVLDAPNGEWDGNEQVIAGLPLGVGQDQPVTFALPTGSVNTGSLLNMRFRLIPAPDPEVADCATVTLRARPNAVLLPTGRADGGEVEDYVIDMAPLAVDVASFTAQSDGSEVHLTWETTSEIDVAGFNVHRMNPGDDAWRQANPLILASRTPGSAQGNRYEWIDRGLPPGGTYAYRLEEVDLGGRSTFLEPVEVTLATPTAVTIKELDGRTMSLPLTAAALFALSTLAVIYLRTKRAKR